MVVVVLVVVVVSSLHCVANSLRDTDPHNGFSHVQSRRYAKEPTKPSVRFDCLIDKESTLSQQAEIHHNSGEPHFTVTTFS